MTLKDLPYIPVKVYKWISADKKELYIFDNNKGDNIINATIYQDNNIDDAINKIGLYLANENDGPFYVWTNNRSLLFTINNVKWDGYNVNPFKAQNIQIHQRDPEYIFHDKDLFNYDVVNIVYAKNLPKELKNNKYYFLNNRIIQPLKNYIKQDAKLLELRNKDDTNVKEINEIYHRINFEYNLDYVVLSNIYDIMHTSQFIDMIQWVNDLSSILYKLYKKHKIKKEYFESWTNIDKITQINVLNIYSILNVNSFCKISIDNKGLILFNYILDSNTRIEYKDIEKHKKLIIKYLTNIIKKPIHIKVNSLNVYKKFEIYKSSFSLLAKKIAEYYNIFHLIKSDIKTLTCIYKRSCNYSNNIDIYSYIKSKLQIGIPKEEIIQDLNNLGIDTNINNFFNNDIEEGNNDKILIEENGTILTITRYNQGYDIYIRNCPNIKELHYLSFWLSKIISTSFDDKNKDNKTFIEENSKSNSNKSNKPDSPKKSDSPKKISSSSSSVDVNDIDFDSLGGAIKKTEKSNYLINMLHAADKELFGENYARAKCQSLSQPVVLSPQEKQNLEDKGELYVDNIIEYGSSPDIKNFYTCPRLWCPQSKIPLSPDDPNPKCPLKNEEPLEMFADNDKTKKRYVKLIKPNEKNMCVPCCMKKEPKPDHINKCIINSNKNNKIINNESKDKNHKNGEDIAENYIMNQNAPIPVGRYGIISEKLHNIIFQNSDNYVNCTKTLNKSHHCIVRKGIGNNKNNSIVIIFRNTICHSTMNIIK